MPNGKRYFPDPERAERWERVHRHESRLTAGDARRAIATLAAELLAEEGFSDYGSAKRKALERLGLPPRTPLPDNGDVEAALKEHLALFGGEEHAQLIHALREAALDLMRQLARFSPHLVGPVLNGTATEASEITLALYTDDMKSVDFALLELGLPYDHVDRNSNAHNPADLVIQLDYEDWPVTLLVFPANELHSQRRSRDGRVLPRADSSALAALLATEAAQPAAPEPTGN